MYHFRHRISSLQRDKFERTRVKARGDFAGVWIQIVDVCFVVPLVRQSSSKVVLDVGVHDGSEVVEPAVPEQVDDEHLEHKHTCRCSPHRHTYVQLLSFSYQWLENQRSIFISVVVQETEERIQDVPQELWGEEGKQHTTRASYSRPLIETRGLNIPQNIMTKDIFFILRRYYILNGIKCGLQSEIMKTWTVNINTNIRQTL